MENMPVILQSPPVLQLHLSNLFIPGVKPIIVAVLIYFRSSIRTPHGAFCICCLFPEEQCSSSIFFLSAYSK